MDKGDELSIGVSLVHVMARGREGRGELVEVNVPESVSGQLGAVEQERLALMYGHIGAG